MPIGRVRAKSSNACGLRYASSGAPSWRRYAGSAGWSSRVYTSPPELSVTIIGSPTLRQPCRTPTPSGPSDATNAATTASVCTLSSWNANVCRPPGSGLDVPPTSGALAPTTLYTPLRICSWRCASPSDRTSRTCEARGSTSAAQPAAVAPAVRCRVDAPVPTPVATAKPGPPRASTTTPLPVSGPDGDITELDEQPISGTAPDTSRMPASTAYGSCRAEQNTTSSLVSGRTACRAATCPAACESTSDDRPTASHRCMAHSLGHRRYTLQAALRPFPAGGSPRRRTVFSRALHETVVTRYRPPTD